METGTHAPALRSANEVPYSPVAFGQQYACLPKLDAILREAQPSAASHRRNLPPITTSGGGEPPGGERRPAFERGAQRNPQLLNRLRRTERNARRGGAAKPQPTDHRPGNDHHQARRRGRRAAPGACSRGMSVVVGFKPRRGTVRCPPEDTLSCLPFFALTRPFSLILLQLQFYFFLGQ